MRLILLVCLVLNGIWAQAQDLQSQIAAKAATIEKEMIEWRRHLHANPELSNREFKTAEYIAKHLRKIGLKPDVGIAHTGIVAVLDSGNPGPTVGLRADIDGLPVTERVDLPFASKVTTEYLGQKTGVMHACGHDAHAAILMATAQILAELKDQLKGKIVFIFQPAEEGAPPGEEGGAKLMVKEGVIADYGVDAVFGLHVSSLVKAGNIHYRPRGIMAAADRFVITVHGKQAHGSRPWHGVDPITVSAQIILGLQTIISRQTELTNEAAVISIGKMTSGVRNNIIPESTEMIGTIRTLDTAMQRIIHDKIRRTATLIAESAGATAEVDIQIGYPVTYNNPELTAKMLPTFEKVIGEENIRVTKAITGAEDFSFFAEQVPGLYFFLGGRDPNTEMLDAPGHHTPDFYIDESGLINGVKVMCQLVVDYKP